MLHVSFRYMKAMNAIKKNFLQIEFAVKFISVYQKIGINGSLLVNLFQMTGFCKFYLKNENTNLIAKNKVSVYNLSYLLMDLREVMLAT